MTKTEIYNGGYVGLNHSYIEIFGFYKKLLEAPDADPEVAGALGHVLTVLNPTLDRIKSEMTVRTRFKDVQPSGDSGEKQPAAAPVKTETQENGGKIFHPDFGA